MKMADGVQKHPYHLVDPSPWPALGAIGALLLAFGAALGMHPDMLGRASRSPSSSSNGGSWPRAS